MVELAVDAVGSIRVTLREGSLDDARSDACVTRLLEHAAEMLPHGASVTLSLRLHVS